MNSRLLARAISGLTVVSLSNAPLRAQLPVNTSPPLAFEVASVKPNQTVGPGPMNFQVGGRFTATNVPLRALIRTAYRLQDFQLIGGSDVLNERFNIVAK